jgi:hypothetical protein
MCACPEDGLVCVCAKDSLVCAYPEDGLVCVRAEDGLVCACPEDGILLPQHVRVLSLLFVYISYCAFGWYCIINK